MSATSSNVDPGHCWRYVDDMTRAGAVSDEKRGQLAEIFMMSSRLEGMFWEMAYTLDQWPDLR